MAADRSTSPAPGNPWAMASAIRHAAHEIGYVDCGFTTTERFEQFGVELETRARLWPAAAGQYRTLLSRTDPHRTAPWAEAIVVCIRRYGRFRLPSPLVGLYGRNYLADRRIDRNPDHDMPRRMDARLRELGLRVKRGGTPDRAAAARAGVAAIGRNGFAYSPACGSWINIETWRVDAPLPPGTPLPCPCPPDCRACLETCPTGAIETPFRMRMDRCVAHLTYGSLEAPIAPELETRMGCWLYGCDDCQTVCPLNRDRWDAREPMPWLDDIIGKLSPQAIASMDLETYRRVVHPLFWYIPDTPEGLERWRGNARRARRHMASREAPVRTRHRPGDPHEKSLHENCSTHDLA